MRVLFLHPNENQQPALQVGIASLAAAAKAEGHDVSLFDTTFLSPRTIDRKFRKIFEESKIDVLAASCRSLEWELVQRLLRLVPEGVFKIVGGAHASVAPEQVMADPRVDAVARGEGEGDRHRGS